MNDRSSLLLRSVSAIVLMIGFYALALGICAVIVGFNWLLIDSGRVSGVSLKILLFSIIALYTIIVAVAPRRDKFEAPGPLLEPAGYPELFALIRDIAGKSGQPAPAEVYLTHDLNAWVAERGGFAGLGSRRVMGVGLPLLQTLDVEELRAVVAHEFGHYHGGDTRIGPWIHKTRSAIGRTLEGLDRSFLRKPFEWYGMLFMRITQAVSRRQEFAADRLGAALAGKEAMGSGLKRVHTMGPLSQAFLEQEVMPAVNRGFRPALASGFNEFLAAPRIAESGSKILEEVLKSEVTNPYDSHPSLRDRLAALGVDHAPPAVSQAPSALTLLGNGNHGELEAALFGGMLGINGATLNPLAWDDSGEKVHRVAMEESLKPAAEAMAALKFIEYPDYMAEPARFEAKLGAIRLPEDAQEKKQILSRLLTVHLVVTLCAKGWRMDSRPGRDVTCFPPSGSVEAPVSFPELSQSLAEGVDPEAWRLRCAAWGLA
jgi:Zn-dependent protease with chaperone function